MSEQSLPRRILTSLQERSWSPLPGLTAPSQSVFVAKAIVDGREFLAHGETIPGALRSLALLLEHEGAER